MGRVAVLIGLLFAAGMTIRGRMPVPHATPRDPAPDSPASTVAVIVLLSASMLVLAVAMLTRRQGPPRPAPLELPGSLRGRGGRWNLRLGLIALGLLIVWLLAVIVLNRLGMGFGSRPAGVPQTVPDTGGAPSSSRPPSGAPVKPGDTARILMAATAVLVVMTVIASVGAAVRRPRREAVLLPADTAAAASPSHEPLAVAAERGLAEVTNRDLPPREAIIACYAAMEQALAGAPDAAPQASDTPSEVLARAVGKGALSPTAASPLVALFTEARFSTHVMTEQHRQSAEQALRSVLAELHARRRGAEAGTPA